MAPKQKMRLANEKHSKNVTNRGNVPKSLVSFFVESSDFGCHVKLPSDHMVWYNRFLTIVVIPEAVNFVFN